MARQSQQWTGWVRPYLRLNRALARSDRLLRRSLLCCTSERSAHRRPIRASLELGKAAELLCRALSRLGEARRELVKVHACLERHPESASCAPELLIVATARWVILAGCICESAGSVFALHHEVLDGIRNGTLIPECAMPRPRIITTPRPTPIRTFLLVRQPRVVDRIAPLLRRRRRTPRPASLRAPQRRVLGRAPPLSISLL